MSAAALPVDVAFTTRLPKIEVWILGTNLPNLLSERSPFHSRMLIQTIQLHAHLTGSISRQCLHEIWATRKADAPASDVEDPLTAIPSGKVDYDIKTYAIDVSLQPDDTTQLPI